MGAFDVLAIANSSLGMHQTWLDAVGHNIANVNTVTSTADAAFQPIGVTAAAAEGGGVDVTGVVPTGTAQGRVTYAPDHPLADADGMVRVPDIDMESQMTQLIMAQRGYQAQVQVTKTARDDYDAALQIGRG